MLLHTVIHLSLESNKCASHNFFYKYFWYLSVWSENFSITDLNLSKVFKKLLNLWSKQNKFIR